MEVGSYVSCRPTVRPPTHSSPQRQRPPLSLLLLRTRASTGLAPAARVAREDRSACSKAVWSNTDAHAHDQDAARSPSSNGGRVLGACSRSQTRS